MESPTLFDPDIQRYYKLSELAGNRWPNATEDDIFNWHDKCLNPDFLFQTPLEKDIIEALNCFRNDNNSLDERNLFGFWVFLTEFRSFLTDYEISSATGLRKRRYKLLPYDLLQNSYFMPDMESTKKLAEKNGQKIDCAVLFDEKGKPHSLAEFDKDNSKWHPGQVEIEIKDLRIKGSSVWLIEKKYPEITKNNSSTMESSGAAGQFQNPQGEKTLEGWADIAAHANRSESHAKRHYRPALTYTNTGRPITTVAVLDAFRLNTSSKKNKKNNRDAR